jgi:hypothetical protein
MKNKRKVSTRIREKNKKIEKIVNILKNFPEGNTPQNIAYYSGINPNTVKSLLPKIPIIKKKSGIRGMYILVDESSHGSIFDWNFHNAQLSYSIPKYTGERIKETYNFGFINYEFEIGKVSKKATLRVSTNRPINISSICCCYLFFLELIKNNATAVAPAPDNIFISSIEFNKDYINLRFDGINCITLDSLLKQFKLYDKKSGIRIEHKLKVPISCDAIFSMLENNAESIEVTSALYELDKKISMVLNSQKRNVDLLLKLLEKINGEKG